LGGVSGFPKRAESEHNIFETGHASTSISAAIGLLCGQDARGVEGNVVVVIGDSSLTSGLAFEALNHAGQLGKKLIIVLNDNNMSVGQNMGALSVRLTRLTASSATPSTGSCAASRSSAGNCCRTRATWSGPGGTMTVKSLFLPAVDWKRLSSPVMS
jgi:deoxyxylulose-5-phosphate synthase